MNWTVHCADVLTWCEDYAAKIERGEAEPFHAILTDPPYGLSDTPDMSEVLTHWLAGDNYEHGTNGFMGKSWDGFVPGPSDWAALRRMCHPGAYLFAFGGTRTADLLSVAIRLGGWERFDEIDSLSWCYGSGFPKSHNIGKAIDKAAGAEREVIGKRTDVNRGGGVGTFDDDAYVWQPEMDVTAPATPLAATWEGYGTALKPAHEPILCFRNPKQGTYAANCLSTGAGALNIDGSRVATGEGGPDASLTGQHPDVILTSKTGGQSWENEQSLCASCAEGVVKKRKPTVQATGVFSVPNNAGQTTNEKEETHQDAISKMDIGCSNGQSQEEQKDDRIASTNLNIDESGKILTGQSQRDISSTISTEIDSTTNLKTCSLCGVKITSGSIHGKAEQKHLSNDTEVNQDTNKSMPSMSVSGGQKNGRWPPNVTISHHPGCERLGVKRVRGAGWRDSDEPPPFINEIYNQGIGKNTGKHYTDPDGTEAVTAYACVLACDACGHQWTVEQCGACPECGGVSRWACAVAELGEQSGVLKSGARTGTGNMKYGGSSYFESATRDNASCEASQGTAARFYPQFSWQHEIAERLAGVVPFRYVSKAGRAQRDAGLETLHDKSTVWGSGLNSATKIRTEEQSKSGVDRGKCRNPHPTIKNIELTKWLATLLLPPPEYAPRRILIPFGGVMSEAIGAVLAGWDEVEAIEMEEEYIPIGEARLRFWADWAARGYDEPAAILKAAKREETRREESQMELL